MKTAIALLLCLALVSSKLNTYNIDTSKVTVGGLSSGAFMAVQMHWAFSSLFSGAAITAGGPYYCAQGQESNALTSCMSLPSGIMVSTLMTTAKSYEKAGTIDKLANLASSKVYLYSGTADSTVKQGVMTKLQTMYQDVNADITTQFTIPSQHAYITTNYGNACSFSGEPYINNCNYDMAWDSLSVLYGTLNPAVPQIPANVISFSQTPYLTTGSSMYNTGYLYVPTSCQQGAKCGLHVAFHGCMQTIADIGTQYVTKLGLNEIAESNNLIILYPQAEKSMMSPSNPNGCWDWWGYTDPMIGTKNYANQKGKQMSIVYNMIKELAGLKVSDSVITE